MSNATKYRIKELKLNNTASYVVLDTETKALHVLDLNEEGTMSITNAMCEGFVERMLYVFVQSEVIEDTDGYSVYTYAPTDGIISQFHPQEKEYTFITRLGEAKAVMTPLYEPLHSLYNKLQGGKLCPRCNENYMDVREAKNALSRRGDYYVCNPCGMAEAMEDMQ
ncbi:hypothetical protein [Bacillus cereus group sp. MYBK215-1]|uniref:hypothetical protein n=1 Tax=unclassified Bacillus cereus group TaxID=2750818 RepID=UPI003F7922F7